MWSLVYSQGFLNVVNVMVWQTMVWSLPTAAMTVPVAAVKNTIVLHSNSYCQADRAGHGFTHHTQLVWKTKRHNLCKNMAEHFWPIISYFPNPTLLLWSRELSIEKIHLPTSAVVIGYQYYEERVFRVDVGRWLSFSRIFRLALVISSRCSWLITYSTKNADPKLFVHKNYTYTEPETLGEAYLLSETTYFCVFRSVHKSSSFVTIGQSFYY